MYSTPSMKYGLVLAIAAQVLFASNSPAAKHKFGTSTVTGLVTDRFNSRIAGASVELVSARQKKKVVVSGYDGSYRITIEPGTYELSARATGFCPGHRSAIILTKHSQTQIDFQLVDCGAVDPVQAPPITTSSIVPPGINGNGYGEEVLNPIEATGVRPLILFGRREEKLSLIYYSGLERGRTFLPAVFTYNLVTLRATTLVYNPRDNSVEGSGEVVWQDGEKTWHGSKIKVLLTGRSPEARLN